MFSNQEDNSVIPVLLAVLLVIAAVVTAGVFLLSLFSGSSDSSRAKQDNNKIKLNSEQNIAEQQDKPQNKQIRKKYLSQLDSLKKNLKQKDYSKDEQINKVTQFLFEAKVPKQFLDSHLQAAIKFRKTKASLGDKEEAATRLYKLMEGISEQK
ncbi:MAG: hypothetical protein ABEJ02_00285 [Candidatus Paceibacteria bacterium]